MEIIKYCIPALIVLLATWIVMYKLFKILNLGSFSFSNFAEGFKKGPKGIIKNIFIILFAIYVFAVMIGMYTAYMVGTYKYLASEGNQEFMPFVSLMVAVAVIMFFGFTSVRIFAITLFI